MDLKSLFDSFYNRFVLRDLFGKIVPGLIVLLAADVCLFKIELIDMVLKGSWFFIILFSGLAWISSFSLQYLGEMVGLLKTSPKVEEKLLKELHNKICKMENRELNSIECQGTPRNLFYKIWQVFQESSNTMEYERIHAERLVIIKEACGNGSVSMALSGLMFIIDQLLLYKNNPDSVMIFNDFVLIIVIFFFSFCLWQAHIRHVRYYSTFISNSLLKK